MIQTGTLFRETYRILSELFHDDNSAVHMALNEKSNEICVVKQIKKFSEKKDDSAFQNKLSEIESFRNCSHPGLQKIIDVISDDNTIIVIMEYIDGTSLDKVLQECSAIDQDSATEKAKQLCRIFDSLHSSGASAVLKNITPRDILIRPDGNITLLHSIKTKTEEEKADVTAVFCFGAILFNLFTGTAPDYDFRKNSSVRKINPSLSGRLDNIIAKCLEQNPDDQYGTFSDILKDLEQIDNSADILQKNQKTKLSVFITSVILTVIFAVMSVCCYFLAESKKNISPTENQPSEESSSVSADSEESESTSVSNFSENSTQ